MVTIQSLDSATVRLHMAGQDMFVLLSVNSDHARPRQRLVQTLCSLIKHLEVLATSLVQSYNRILNSDSPHHKRFWDIIT